ncbi:MAG TPA: hypothetical protein VFE47_15845 [Tepidisphaeraceae bacterium]|jgi:predicted RNA-binding Zn-ribbon protein involved in translation (DUF1610 family)|nr:hypothetical protein [Tepidisphaeraceae bacterium]
MDGRSNADHQPASLFSRTARFFAPVWRWRKRDPGPPIKCPYCGYELRPLPKACPSCGAVIANGRVSRGQAADPLVAKLRIAIPPRPAAPASPQAHHPAEDMH